MLPGLPSGPPWPVNTRDPVNRHHPLNRGRGFWFMAVPPLVGGIRWYDLMGLSSGLLLNSPAWRGGTRPGGTGQLRFDGVNMRVSVSSSVTLDGGQPFTIALWTRLLNFSSNVYPHALCVASQNTGASECYEVTFSNQSGYDGVLIGGAGNWARLHSGTSAATLINGWHHVVITYLGGGAGTAAQFTCYFDGLPLTLSGASIFSTLANATSIGGPSSGGGSSNWWVGDIDDVSAWPRRAFSAVEVKQLYNLSRAGYPGMLNRLSPASAVSGGTTGGNRRRRVLLCAGGG